MERLGRVVVVVVLVVVVLLLVVVTVVVLGRCTTGFVATAMDQSTPNRRANRY